MPTSFQELAELCERLQSTKKRKAMVNWVASFITQLEPAEIEPAISMLIGRAFPKWDQRVLDLSWRTVTSTIRKITNIDDSAFSRTLGKTGDLGDAIRILFEQSKIRKQTILFQKQLTILEIRRTFDKIAETTGTGSREKKDKLIETLLGSATPLEAKYLVKVLIGEMRTGFHEGLMETAVANAFKIPLNTVRTASMLTGDIGEVATLAKVKGEKGLQKLDFKLFRPVEPMLAQTSTSITEVLKEHDGQTALEYKLDGARVQIHKSKDIVRIFSRRLTDVTESLPEIVELIRNEIKANEGVLEGEIIAVGKDGTPMMFQHLMRRFRRIRKVGVIAEAIPLQLYLFDAFYIDGSSLINEVYSERRKRLADVAGDIPLTEQVVVRNAQVAEGFLNEAIEAGHEGLMAKRLDSLYTPGVRGKAWLKIKKILEPLDLVVVAAEYGYGRRRGWLSNYYLAARDDETDELLVVGKTFKGLTDTEIVEMTRRLRRLVVRDEGFRVFVVPEIVVEVAYNEIQRSSKYESGMALRFARITRVRDDRGIRHVDSIERVRKIFERQFLRKVGLG